MENYRVKVAWVNSLSPLLLIRSLQVLAGHSEVSRETGLNIVLFATLAIPSGMWLFVTLAIPSGMSVSKFKPCRPVCIVRNKGMPLSNTTLELESFLPGFPMTVGHCCGVGGHSTTWP